MRMIMFFLVFMMIGSVSASVAVSSKYSGKFPLILERGESEETFFKLFNSEQTDKTLKGLLISGEEIAVLTDSLPEYRINAGEKIIVGIKISIPEDALPGRYDVTALFKPVEENKGGVQIVESIGLSFPVIVSGEEKNEPSLTQNIEELEQEDVEQSPLEGFLSREKSREFNKTAVFIVAVILIIAGIAFYLVKTKS